MTYFSDEGKGRKGCLFFFFFLAYLTTTQVKTEISHVQWEVGKHSCLNRSQSVIRFRPKESRKMDREHSENDRVRHNAAREAWEKAGAEQPLLVELSDISTMNS